MGVVLLLVAAGGTGTGTAADGVEDLPLSPEDLALIEQLGAATETGTAGPAAQPGVGRIELWRVGRGRIRESLGRNIAEALDALPLPLDFGRSFVTGDFSFRRGLRGHRAQVFVDGVRLRHAMSPRDGGEEWATVDAWNIDGVALDPGGRELRIETVAGPDRGHETEVCAGGRSADRSAFAHLLAGGAGVHAAVSVQDFRQPDASQHATSDEPSHQRVSAYGRGRLGLGEAVTVEAGGGIERLWGIGTRQRGVAFTRASLGGETIGGDLFGAYQAFATNAGRDEETSRGVQARIQAHVEPFDALRISASAEIDDGHASFIRARTPGDGELREIGGQATAELVLGPVQAELTGRILNGRSALTKKGAEPLAVEVTEPLTEARLRVNLAEGAFAIRAGWTEDLVIPTARDLLDEATAQSEMIRTLEAGPSLALDAAAIDLTGFLTWLDGARIEGVEAAARWRLTEGLSIAGAAAWAQGAPEVPGVLARAHVRYEIEARNAYAEAFVRTSFPPRSGAGDRAVRISARGGADLGAGIRLEIAIDNVLDEHTRPFGSAAATPGVDLRVALSHAW